MPNDFLSSVQKQFSYYKMLGDQAMAQVPGDQLSWQYNEASNSIATIVNHLSGNMLSRWTDFLTSDGEKEWRDRDAEFDPGNMSREATLSKWEAGWKCLFEALASLTPDDLGKEIFIRNMGHTVLEAINRQLAHYPYHVGQIVFIARMITGADWQSLSIPKGNSKTYNAEKFSQPKRTEHFTDELLGKTDEV